MSEQDDRVFLQRFSMVLAGLVGFTVVIILLSLYIHRQLTLSDNPAREQAMAERIKPVAAVYAGETGRAAAQEAAAAASVDAGGEAAFGGSEDPEQIYSAVCQTCHVSGAAGAPLMEPGAWDDRLDKGLDTLVEHAINGFNAMPPKGGRTDLTDEQVRVTVEWMVDQVDG